MVCERCHSVHERTHHQYFVQCKGIQWAPLMQGLELERLCDHCAQTHKDRAECPTCLANICIRCWGEDDRRASWIKKHHDAYAHHKQLTFIYPEHCYMLNDYQADCECIDDKAYVAHCSRCLKRKYIHPVCPFIRA